MTVAIGDNDSPVPGSPAYEEGEPPLHRLLADYASQMPAGVERLYGIFSASPTTSLAPLVYNTAFRSLGLPALYLPFSTGEFRRTLAELVAGLDELGLPLLGAAVAAPHKEAALALAAEATPLARRAGAASLLVRRPSGWWADTEAAGVVATLTGRGVALADRRIAVIGCGGAGRAAAAGLSEAGARVTLVNRSLSRARRAAERLGLPCTSLGDFDPRGFSVLVHATPVANVLPFRLDGLGPAAVVFDFTYRDGDTPLVAAARRAGHVTIDGRELMLVELARQFHLMTGHRMPVDDVRAALGAVSSAGTDLAAASARSGGTPI